MPWNLYNVALQLDRSMERRRLTSISHARVVREALEHFARGEAAVYAWLVMPDHIHLLFAAPREVPDIDEYLGRIKRTINKGLARRGLPEMHWRDGVVVHEISPQTLASAREYILQNPVRGQYVKQPEDWPHYATPEPLPPATA